MHEKRLLNTLLAQYNTLERPVANESDPLVVKFGLTLQQIIDVVSVTLGNRSGGINTESISYKVKQEKKRNVVTRDLIDKFFCSVTRSG